MKNIIILFLLITLISSCQKNYKIDSLTIGEKQMVMDDLFNSNMILCLENEIGNSNFSFTMNVKTKDGRNFKCSKDVFLNSASDVKAEDKCVGFHTRDLFSFKGANDEDFKNLNSMVLNNIVSIRLIIWDDNFENIITEKTFYYL